MKARFNHVGIRVRDLDHAVSQYKSLFGASATSLGPGNPILCCLPDGRVLELFEEGEGYAAPGAPSIGLIHYALGVDNVDQAYAEAIKEGCSHFSSPTQYELALFGGILVTTAFVVDWNGVCCEFIDEDWSDRIIAYAEQYAPEQRV